MSPGLVGLPTDGMGRGGPQAMITLAQREAGALADACERCVLCLCKHMILSSLPFVLRLFTYLLTHTQNCRYALEARRLGDAEAEELATVFDGVKAAAR